MKFVRRLLFAVGDDARHVPWLIAQMTAVALLELLTIGGIPPLVSLLTRPEGAVNRPGMRTLYALSGASDTGAFIWIFGLALLLLFVLKAILSAATSYRQFKFSYHVQMALGKRMLERLLAHDYAFFLQQNTAILLKNVTTEVLLFAGGVLIPTLQLVTQAMILITIVALLAWASAATAALTVGIIGGMIGLLYILLHRRLNAWGIVREAKLSELNRTTHQALAGVKAVKTTGSEGLFLDEFARHGLVYARSNTLYQTAAVTPPLIIELVLFGGGIAVMLYYSQHGRDVRTLLPLVTLFGVAAYRILPAARLIFAHVVTIRYNMQSLNVIVDALRDWSATPTPISAPSARPARALPLQTEIRLNEVSYQYPGANRSAIEDISLSIKAGTHVAFVGSSGAGKTTVMDLVLGLLAPTSGTIEIDGQRLTPELRPQWQRTIGYVPQQVFLADATLRRNIAFGVPTDLIDDRAAQSAVQRACLSTLVGRLPKGLDTDVGENGARLSGGERQRVAIARALYTSPSVLILDEATSALDSVTERDINDELLESAGGLTIIIVAHRLSTVRNCDRLILIKNGRIEAEGGYDDLVRQSEEFAEMERLAVGS
ncbi:MAG: ABC transporter ATP-binding protein/permease [Gemmatimonadota bacterium]|nr:ABC transporter ATP-binding protein/permease [Gemmatimonadota bacterium]